MLLLFSSSYATLFSVWTESLDHITTLGEATWLEKIIRPFLVYIVLVILLRLFGKRELAQLNPLDLVVLLSLSNTVQNAIIGDDNSVVGGVIGAVALLTVNYLTVFAKYKSKRLETLLEGKSVVLVEDGKLQEDALRDELLTKEDLRIVAHRQNFKDMSHVERCELDPNGSFLVEGRNEEQRQRDEILQRLKELQGEIAELKTALAKN